MLNGEREAPLLAWRVEVNTMSAIAFAETKAKARWQAVKAYWSAGYGRGPGTWPDVTAYRAPRFDGRSSTRGRYMENML